MSPSPLPLSFLLLLSLSLLLLPSPTFAVSPTQVYSTPTTFTITSSTKTVNDDFNNIGYSECLAVNGVNTPRLVLTRGVTYTFINNAAPTHPVYLTSSSAGASAGTRFMNPISTAGGSSTWVANPAGVGTVTLYYECFVHSSMGNIITVIDPPGRARPATGWTTCDWYTDANGGNHAVAADQVSFLTSLFTRGLVGYPSSNPPVEGLVVNPYTAPFFTVFNVPGAARDTHISHLVGFFGASSKLGCTSAGFPAYTGVTNMRALHASMFINQSMWDAFTEQSRISALSLGFSEIDANATIGSFKTFLNAGNANINTAICTELDCACAPNWSGVGCTVGPARPSAYTICDWYTGAVGLDPKIGTNSVRVLRAMVDRAFNGSSTSTPNVLGIFNNPILVPFFPNRLSQPHVEHIVQFFGVALQCAAPDFPAYAGNPNMREVHAPFNITYTAFNAFLGEVGLAANSFGISDADINRIVAMMSAFLRVGIETYENEICNDEYSCPCATGYDGDACDHATGSTTSSGAGGGNTGGESGATGGDGSSGTSSGSSNPPSCVQSTVYHLNLLPKYKLQWSLGPVEAVSEEGGGTGNSGYTAEVQSTGPAGDGGGYYPYSHQHDHPDFIQPIDISPSHRQLLSVGPFTRQTITISLSGYDIKPGLNGFLGFGFGTSMVDADVILCFLDEESQPRCFDSWTESFDPQPDELYEGGRDDLFNVSAVIREDGLTTFTFSRYLNTGDPFDFVIPAPPSSTASNQIEGADDFDTKIIFSHGPSSNNGFIHQSVRGGYMELARFLSSHFAHFLPFFLLLLSVATTTVAKVASISSTVKLKLRTTINVMRDYYMDVRCC
jgi:truncated hemoglobin YjbI